MKRPTFVLGAGFSRAISKFMPLTDELGSACREVLPPTTPGPPRELSGGFFELWLSQLAEEQPYLNTQQNLINQATFVAYSSAIAEVLEQRTDRILRDGLPGWLVSFVKAAHLTRATLATFNYDTLIECAVVRSGSALLRGRPSAGATGASALHRAALRGEILLPSDPDHPRSVATDGVEPELG
jgi:hypothetical protein